MSKINAKETNRLNKKIKKLYYEFKKQLYRNENNFYFDNGNVCSNYDLVKNEIKYSVMLVNTDISTNNYIVYLLMIINNKSIPQLLIKNFKGKKGSQKYYEELCEFINDNSNYDIVNRCYKQKFNCK